MVPQCLNLCSGIAALVLITIAIGSSYPIPHQACVCEQNSSSVSQDEIVTIGNVLVRYALEGFQALLNEVPNTQPSGVSIYNNVINPTFLTINKLN